MENQIVINMKNVIVEWIGMTEPFRDKETKKVIREPQPSIQLKFKQPDGKSALMIAQRSAELIGVNVGDCMDVELAQNNFKGVLYYKLLKVEGKGAALKKGVNI